MTLRTRLCGAMFSVPRPFALAENEAGDQCRCAGISDGPRSARHNPALPSRRAIRRPHTQWAIGNRQNSSHNDMNHMNAEISCGPLARRRSAQA